MRAPSVKVRAQINSWVIPLLAVAIMLLFVLPSFTKLFAATTADCRFQLVVKSLEKKLYSGVTLGAGPIIKDLEITEPECVPKPVTITNAMITDGLRDAYNDIDSLVEDRLRTYSFYSASRFFRPARDESAVAWAVDRVIANEVSDCWDKVGRGTVDAFDTAALPKNQLANVFLGENGVVSCVLCSTIVTEKDVSSLNLESFDTFTKVALVPKDKTMTYDRYIKGTTSRPAFLHVQNDMTTEKPLAVLYVRVAKSNIRELLDAITPESAGFTAYNWWAGLMGESLAQFKDAKVPPEVVHIVQVSQFSDEEMGLERCTRYYS